MRYTLIFSALFMIFSNLSVYAQGANRGKDYALFFAVDEYDHMNGLNQPVKNANDIASELADNYGFEVKVIANPTFAEIADEIHRYQDNFASGEFDQAGQLLIFFTGHGVEKGHNGYFLPKDGNPDRLYEKVIEYDYWRNEIDRINCQHILVTIDACYSLSFDPNWGNKSSRSFGRKGDRNKDQVLLDHQAYKARLFITSDGTGNQTPDRSTLARQFLLGLRERKTKPDYLHAAELYASYLKAAAPVPGGGDFGSDEPGSRFLFFPNRTVVPTETRTDLAAWTAAKAANNCAGYKDYLAQFPTGDFVALARQRVKTCEKEEEMLAAWNLAKQTDTKRAYQIFMKQHPDSPYAELAALAIDEKSTTTLAEEKPKRTPSGVTPEQVLKNYVSAIGGSERISKVRSVTQVMGGKVQGYQLTHTTFKEGGDKYAALSEMGQTVMSETRYNEGKGIVMQQGRKRPPTPDELGTMEETAALFPTVALLDRIEKISVSGTEKISGTKAIVLVERASNGAKYYYFDTQTHLLLQIVTELSGTQ
ncbi:MAG: caspase family protein, partial [Bacteroidota bacterium]